MYSYSAAKKLARRRWDPPPKAVRNAQARERERLGDFSERPDIDLIPDAVVNTNKLTHEEMLELWTTGEAGEPSPSSRSSDNMGLDFATSVLPLTAELEFEARADTIAAKCLLDLRQYTRGQEIGQRSPAPRVTDE
ncbi:hypothetical protein B0H14DRAFT_3425776 [Mycena olivaceomarginata]|nr:hypothetical protein B0H14DRAFT_3425776 [Mycena olivaceomarginata]